MYRVPRLICLTFYNSPAKRYVVGKKKYSKSAFVSVPRTCARGNNHRGCCGFGVTQPDSIDARKRGADTKSFSGRAGLH